MYSVHKKQTGGCGGELSRYKGPEECGRKVLISLRLDSATSRDEGTAVGLKENVSPLNANADICDKQIS